MLQVLSHRLAPPIVSSGNYQNRSCKIKFSRLLPHTFYLLEQGKGSSNCKVYSLLLFCLGLDIGCQHWNWKSGSLLHPNLTFSVLSARANNRFTTFPLFLGYSIVKRNILDIVDVDKTALETQKLLPVVAYLQKKGKEK